MALGRPVNTGNPPSLHHTRGYVIFATQIKMLQNEWTLEIFGKFSGAFGVGGPFSRWESETSQSG